jgi:hypothetical protein
MRPDPRSWLYIGSVGVLGIVGVFVLIDSLGDIVSGGASVLTWLGTLASIFFVGFLLASFVLGLALRGGVFAKATAFWFPGTRTTREGTKSQSE